MGNHAFFSQRMAEFGSRDAIVWNDRVWSYDALLEGIAARRKWLVDHAVVPGTVVALEADFSAPSIMALLALLEHGCIVVPLSSFVDEKKRRFVTNAQVEVEVRCLGEDLVLERSGSTSDHELYQLLRSDGHAGVVLFSSGSSGDRKAIVHDFDRLLGKFKTPRPSVRSIAFLHFDHIGGLNTLLHVLSNGGCLVLLRNRDPDEVLRSIAAHGAELLPTSPTFLNLLLLSQAHKRHDIRSLRRITYGTEPMSQQTLKRLGEVFPGVQLQQTYGLSELGILRSKSQSSDSLWVRVGGSEFQTRVVEGKLEIKADSAMLGYLNAPSPFTADGWFRTGDAVDVKGEYLRFLGRENEIINVGGEKVIPTEVESVLLEMDEIAEATVLGSDHPLTGSIVCARVRWIGTGKPMERRARIKSHCHQRLNDYEVPARILFDEGKPDVNRLKKERRLHGQGGELRDH